MANNNTAFSIGTVFDTYILLAIIAAAIALVTDLIHLTVYTPYAVLAAIMAAISAYSTQYASTGNVMGTQIPVHTIIIFIVAAVLVTIELVFSQLTQWTPQTVEVGIVYFLTTLMHEVQTGQPAATTPPTGATSTPPAAGPPAAGART